jgi:hypothetical protein
MQGKCIAWAVAVLTVGLVAADVLAQTSDVPPAPDFTFRPPLPPLHDPQPAYSWPYSPPSNVYGPPVKAEPAARSTETGSTARPCTDRSRQRIPDGGFDTYAEHRAISRGLRGEADMRARDRTSAWPGYCVTSGE